jgi:hypothetical protein
MVFWKPAIECLRVDMDSPKDEIEEEIEYWSEVLAEAIELADQETKKSALQAINLLNIWMDE